jgi:SET domain-containing protein
VGWSRDVTRQIITYRTLRSLAEGEELCISYGEDGRLGFVDADAEAVRREAEERLAREEREMLRLGVDEGEGEG